MTRIYQDILVLTLFVFSVIVKFCFPLAMSSLREITKNYPCENKLNKLNKSNKLISLWDKFSLHNSYNSLESKLVE